MTGQREPPTTPKAKREALYRRSIRAFRGALVAKALADMDGNRSHAAAALGINRTYLLRLIRELAVPGATAMTERCPLCGEAPVYVGCGLDRACHDHFHVEATQRARPIVVESVKGETMS